MQLVLYIYVIERFQSVYIYIYKSTGPQLERGGRALRRVVLYTSFIMTQQYTIIIFQRIKYIE